jgi:NADPH:quinone reductase-like Zn-dependent oxidoreductase
MQAAVRYKYGPPEVLHVRDVPKPVPANNELLVKVCATTVNRTDCGILTGKPYLIRAFTGLIKPRSPITGTDFAGMVEAAGKDVRNFKAGDRVWGLNDEGLASHAEYMCIGADKGVAHIPEGISYEAAAASAEGAHYAYNFISKVKIGPGSNVLVNGGTGAIGSAAIQLLKHFGAKVTAVTDTAYIDVVKSLGADKIIDYTTTDFTKAGQEYHLVCDAVGKSEFGKCRALLLPKGIYISSELGPNAENLYLPLITAIRGGHRVIFPIPVNVKRSLAIVKELLELGKFRPLIDRRYPLTEIADAYRYVMSGKKRGNVVVSY